MNEKYKNIQEYVVALRRLFHQIPETGNELPKTQAMVCAELDKLGISYRKGNLDSSVIATIEGSTPGKVVALRADMDALPVFEKTGLSFESEHIGKMHACGHDAHMAMLLGAAKILSEHRDEIKGTVKLLFQTGEEIVNGAAIMVKDKALENPDVDAVFGMHVGSILDPNIPSGTVVAMAGPVMAACDRFELKILGHGCHGSTPEKGIDPVVIAANVVLALQTIISRSISATKTAVLTIGSINGGDTYNVIPGSVSMSGTLRTFDEETRKFIGHRIGEVASGVAATYGGSCEYEMHWGSSAVINPEDMATLVAEAAAEVIGEEQVMTSRPSPNMGGEDFSCFLAEKPGAYFFLSSANPDVKGSQLPHHNEGFTVDESVLGSGSEVFVNIAHKYLNR